MKTIVLELPEDPELWPEWLESRMVGLDLYDLVVGLRAIEASPAESTLQDLCGPQLPQILESGLKVLSTSQIRSLLKCPELLLELQELILSEGSEYWDSVETSSEVEAIRSRSLASVTQALQGSKLADNEKPQVALNPSTSSDDSSRDPVKQKRKLTSYLPIVALAAAVLLAITIWSPKGSDGGGWGFDKSGLLSAQVSGRTYLNSLSEAAGSFGKKTPNSKESALQRLTEFRAGCKKLIAAPNNQLENGNYREWLVSECKEWLVKIEGHIAELESGKKAWQDVMAEANETAKRMQQALRDKALELT